MLLFVGSGESREVRFPRELFVEKGRRGREKKRRRERGADWKRCRKDDFKRGKGGNGLVEGIDDERGDVVFIANPDCVVSVSV